MGTYEQVKQLHRLKASVRAANAPKLPENEMEEERHLRREQSRHWKVVCRCGKVWFLDGTDISGVNDEMQYTHPAHEKAVFMRENIGHQEFRGRIPAMDKEE